MKKKILLFMLALSSTLVAGEFEEFKYIDNLYKEQNFKMALSASEEFLERYPASKYSKDMKDKVAKLYFLQKNYKKAEEIFKSLYIVEEKKSGKEEYAAYLARTYAYLNNPDSALFYLNEISSKKTYQKTLFALGQDFLAKENNEAAEKIFTEIIDKKFDNYEEAILNLGIVKYNLKDYDNAFATLNEYSRKEPKKNIQMVDFLKASALYKNNKTDEAIQYFDILANQEQASEYSKKSILYLIEIYSNKKDEEKVSYYLDKIKGTKEYNTAMIMIGDLYVTKGNYDRALRYYSQSDDPNNPRLIYGQAYSLYKKEEYQQALKKFESLKDTDYYNQSIYHIFAINYKLKKFNEIIENREIIRRVVVSQTDTDNIIRIIANSAYQVGNYKLAKDYYGRLFAVSPDKENLFRVILLDSQILDMDDLSNRFAQYKRVYPDDTEYKKDIYLYTGDAYYKTGNYSRAEEIYKEYLDEYTNVEIISSLMSTLLEQKKYEEMDSYLSRVNDDNSLNYLKGVAALGSGKYDEAENQFQKVLASNDGSLNTKVYLNRVRNFFLASKYSEAISAGETYLSKINPEKEKAIYSEMLDKIALSYFRLGKYNEARTYYSKMSTLNGYEVYGKYQIADSYYNEKNYARAGELFKEVYRNYAETFYGEQAYYRYINTLSLQGETALFEKEKNNFLATYPNSSLKNSLINLSANFYTENNDTEKAIETLNTLKSSTDDNSIKENNNIKIISLKLKNKEYKDIEKYINELADEERDYYLAQYYEAKKDSKLVGQYEKLLKYPKYKNYASKNLGDYYFERKDLTKAKKYYTQHSPQEDYMIYRIAQADESLNNLKAALNGYSKLYTKNGSFTTDATLKAAEIYDRQDNVAEAKKLFLKLYSVKNNKDLHNYTLEKLIYYRLVENNMKEANKYYKELQKLDKQRASKFKDYF